LCAHASVKDAHLGSSDADLPDVVYEELTPDVDDEPLTADVAYEYDAPAADEVTIDEQDRKWIKLTHSADDEIDEIAQPADDRVTEASEGADVDDDVRDNVRFSRTRRLLSLDGDNWDAVVARDNEELGYIDFA
jgi:hypothetical protein